MLKPKCIKMIHFMILSSLLGTLSCEPPLPPPEKTTFSPLKPESWISIDYPVLYERGAARLIIEEDGLFRLDGAVLSKVELQKRLVEYADTPLAKCLEILLAPNTRFYQIAPVFSLLQKSSCRRLGFLVAEKSVPMAPAMLMGIDLFSDPQELIFLSEKGLRTLNVSIDSLEESILLAVSPNVSSQTLYRSIETVSGCDKTPCLFPKRTIKVVRNTAIDLNAFALVTEGVYRKKKPLRPQKSREEIRQKSVKRFCPKSENVSVIEVPCQKQVPTPYKEILQGSEELLLSARVCYRVFMECTKRQEKVVYVNGDTGEILLVGLYISE